jgi:hypothetical protein
VAVVVLDNTPPLENRDSVVETLEITEKMGHSLVVVMVAKTQARAAALGVGMVVALPAEPAAPASSSSDTKSERPR